MSPVDDWPHDPQADPARSRHVQRDDDPAPDETPLTDLTRKALNEIAAELGVEQPEKLKTKALVVDAIERARDASE